MSIIAVLALIAVVSIIVLLGIMMPAEGDNPSMQDGFRIGRTVAGLFIPGLIAYAIAGRKKARKPNQFALIFCLLGLGLNGVNAMSSLSGSTIFETPEQHVGRLMREAAGVQPVHESVFPSRRRTDDALRNEFRNLVQTNREYYQTVNKMDVSEVKTINTVESFADPAVAAAGLRQLHAVYDVDSAQEIKVKEIQDNLRRALESSAGSASERETMVNGFDKGVAEQLAKRTTLVAAEKAWVDAVDEEYAYANRHSSGFHLQNGHLVIPDATVRQALNSRIDAQEARRKEFLKAQGDFQQFQAQALDKMGVKPRDIGADRH
jgi:hypothetical protein